jgi:hypothetical protein
MANYSNPSPDTHLEVLYRQTYNTYGQIVAAGLTQDNRVGNNQKTGNSRLNAATPKGILAGSVVAVAGDGLIGPCAGDSTTVADMAVGIAVINALGNPYESSSAVASNRVVYAHGTGTVIRTDIYETVKNSDGVTLITYTAGDKMYASQNGLLTNADGLISTPTATYTLMGILLQKPTGTDPYMVVQLRV